MLQNDATHVAFVFRQCTLKFDSSVGLTKSRRSCSHRWSPAWQGSQQVDKCLGLGFEVRGVRGLGFIVMPEFECVEHICQNSLRCPLWLLQDQKGLHRKAVSFHQQEGVLHIAQRSYSCFKLHRIILQALLHHEHPEDSLLLPS